MNPFTLGFLAGCGVCFVIACITIWVIRSLADESKPTQKDRTPWTPERRAAWEGANTKQGEVAK